MVVVLAVVLWSVYHLTLRHEFVVADMQAQLHAAPIARELASHDRLLERLAVDDQVKRLLQARDGVALERWIERQRQGLAQDIDLVVFGNDYQPAAFGVAVPPGCEAVKTLPERSSIDGTMRALGAQARYFAVAGLVRDELNKEILGVVCASFEVARLQAILAELVEPGQSVALRDASGRIVTQAGDLAKNAEVLDAAVAIARSDWRLHLSQAMVNHSSDYLVIGGILLLILSVPIALSVFNRRLMRFARRDLEHIADVLRLAGRETFVFDPPPSKVEETATLLPAIQRIFRDLSRNQQTINELSFSDSLTALPNRQYFLKMFGHAFQLARRGADICLLMLEVSDFKKANDMLGSEAADELLKMVAETLREQTRKSDFGGRLGVYNFGAIFYNAKGHLMHNRLAQLQQDFVKRQKRSAATAGDIYCKLTLGMTYIDAQGDKRPEDTLFRAENALRSAKRIGGNHMEIVLPSPTVDEKDTEDNAAPGPQPAASQKSERLN
ncbi:MAG: GGDEF domain-containing protein [Acidiferrobacterales bacterium]